MLALILQLDQTNYPSARSSMSHQIIEIRRGVPSDHKALNAVMRRASLAVESGEVLRLLLAEPSTWKSRLART